MINCRSIYYSFIPIIYFIKLIHWFINYLIIELIHQFKSTSCQFLLIIINFIILIHY